MPKWIYCSEKYPTQFNINEGWFLVTRKNKDTSDRLYWKDNQWGYFYNGKFIIVTDVIAWMSLPKVANENNNGN